MSKWLPGEESVSRSLEFVPQFIVSGMRRGIQSFHPLPTSVLPTVSHLGHKKSRAELHKLQEQFAPAAP